MALTQAEIQRRYKERHPDRVKEIEQKYWRSKKGKECQHRKNTNEKGKQRRQRYNKTEKGKLNNIKKCRKYSRRHREELSDYNITRRPNKEKNLERGKQWAKTERGRQLRLKNQHIRERNLGFNILCENILDESFTWHHIDNENVIAVPRDLHELFTRGKDVEKHRGLLEHIVEQLYPVLKKEKDD